MTSAPRAAWLAKLVLFVVILVDVASAAAVGARFFNGTNVSWKPSAASQRNCDSATFATDTKLEPANWRECAALYSTWAVENGTFRVARTDGKTYMAIVEGRDCTLSVEPADASKGPYALGDGDVDVLLGYSLSGFSRGTLLAVRGTIKCDVGGGGRAALLWKISKSAAM